MSWLLSCKIWHLAWISYQSIPVEVHKIKYLFTLTVTFMLRNGFLDFVVARTKNFTNKSSYVSCKSDARFFTLFKQALDIFITILFNNSNCAMFCIVYIVYMVKGYYQIMKCSPNNHTFMENHPMYMNNMILSSNLRIM